MVRAVSLTKKEAGWLSRYSAATAGSKERHFTYTAGGRGGNAEIDALSIIQRRGDQQMLAS